MHVSNYERRNVEVRRAELVTRMFERFAVAHNILRREKYCIDNKYNMPIYGFSVNDTIQRPYYATITYMCYSLLVFNDSKKILALYFVKYFKIGLESYLKMSLYFTSIFFVI